MDAFPDSQQIDGFEDIRFFLSDIPYIGHGGCGISALAMYRWLVKKGFNQHSLSFFMGYNRHSSYVNNSHAYANNEDLPNACSHVGLLIQYENGDLIIGCDNRIHINSYTYSQIVDENALISALNTNVKQWNWEFDRSKHVPEIEVELEIDLSDIELY